MKKILLIFVFIIGVVILAINPSYSQSDISSDADSFLAAANNATSSDNSSQTMNSAISEVAGLLTGIGVIAAVIVAAILGIQFMIGSMEQQAKVKESLIPYFVGCVVVFGALGIWQLVIGALNSSV